ncbi:MAG TPA: C25 family cysteine peptidase, partial [Puia sp.]
GAPDASIKFGLTGSADNARTVQVSVNGTQVDNEAMNSFNDLLTTKNIPLAVIGGSSSATVSFTSSSPVSSDRMVVSFYELTYPRQFNFGGQNNFTFTLPGKSSGYLLNITNFFFGSAGAVLYDLTGGARYTAVVNGGTLSFAIGGFTAPHKFVLVNPDPSFVKTVTGLTAKRFVDYGSAANQGNYIIISNPMLYTGTHGNNPVIDYKNYRSSVAGGGFNTLVADIYELVDQFAFGIKQHPLSIQNFLRYARAKFAGKPQFALLIGHGMVYSDYYYRAELGHDPMAEQLNMVPTFGNPASDNKLGANNGVDAVPVTPIGRLSVINGAEIEIYLEKIKEYEQAQNTSPNTIDGRLWMKSFLHLTGVSEPFLGTILCNYMADYAKIIKDTICGVQTALFCDGNANAVSQVPTNVISNLFSTGLSVVNYFGHSSNTVLGYNLENPNDYNNAGKYPVFFINGCDAGDFFIYDPNRMSGTSQTLSELYVLAKQRGSIGFVASTHFGIVNYLNILLDGLYKLMNGKDYGKPLGVLQQDALQGLINAAPNDYFARLHAEEMTTHGDPYLKLNQNPTDYDVESSTVQISPSFVSVSNSSFNVNARFYNLGRATSDSVVIQVTRIYPNGNSEVLLKKKIKGIAYSDSVQLTVPILPTRDKGQNKIIVSINPGNVIPEATYSNNSVTSEVFIYQDGATPVYPYDYAIINTPTSKLVASTANPLIPTAQYIMQIDTTQSFNSPLKVEKSLTASGGILEYDPGFTYLDSVV